MTTKTAQTDALTAASALRVGQSVRFAEGFYNAFTASARFTVTRISGGAVSVTDDTTGKPLTLAAQAFTVA